MAKGETYEQFIEKFQKKPDNHKMTTDDCYTPRQVYESLLQWADNRYNLKDTEIVRPFYPGGDYEHYDYPDGCVVIDNPPFSIYRKVVRFYLSRGIRFILFAPTRSMAVSGADVCYIVTGVMITYENGAEMGTSFVTNMEPSVRILTSSTLRKSLHTANQLSEAYRTKHGGRPELLGGVNQRKFRPMNVTSPSLLERIANRNIDIAIDASDVKYLKSGDIKKMNIFGGTAFLLSPVASVAVNRAFQMADFIDYQREGHDAAPDICFDSYPDEMLTNI